MSLKVNNIFYSLQGEGGRAGQASVFVRLSTCNLACSFCDTDFYDGEELSLDEILHKIESFGCPWIIWTGGEPSLQLNDKVVGFFKAKGYKQAIETNGTRPLPDGLDYITCSPKQNFEKIKNRIPYVDELRFPIQKGDPMPNMSQLPKAKRFFLSPIFEGENVVKENVDYCIQLIKNNPDWELSIQLHKLIGIE